MMKMMLGFAGCAPADPPESSVTASTSDWINRAIYNLSAQVLEAAVEIAPLELAGRWKMHSILYRHHSPDAFDTGVALSRRQTAKLLRY